MVVGKEFSTISGDILDFLKSISGVCTYMRCRFIMKYISVCAVDLKSCVFSFACGSPSNPMYLEALEERCDLCMFVY